MIEIETERLLLRNWRRSDTDDLFEYARSPEVGPHAGWPEHADAGESRRIIDMFIDDDDVWALELKSERKVIGSIGLHMRLPDEREPALRQREVGYVLNPAYWGRALVPEAVDRVLQAGFEGMELDVIWCGHFEENLKSKRVNEKCGFRFRYKNEKELPLLDGKKVICWYYSINRWEYFEKNPRQL